MVLVGKGTADDAGVYKIDDNLALIQTLDFFTPVVDDPFDFGRIAAANSLSDVYAMGGVPKTAMNIVAFPVSTIELKNLHEILAGGATILRQADTVLLGGHSVVDDELKYGLSITGFVHPNEIWTNQGLRPDDCLILTKALGTGIINTAIKGGLATAAEIEAVTKSMVTINRTAAEVIRDFSISACTDVTGFGLIGHLCEMIAGTDREARLTTSTIPLLAGTYNYAAMGLVPIGSHRNRDYRQKIISAPADFDPVLRDILFDPQTSGGLLFGCRQEEAEKILSRLHDSGITDAAIIGTVNQSGNNGITLLK